MNDPFRYAAFISYSSKDASFAGRLHRELERYRIPKALGAVDLLGNGSKTNRIYPIFRDREELSAGKLGDAIKAALDASGALLVVCSPNGASSQWVAKEIEYFIGIGRKDRVFAIIAENAPIEIDSHDATSYSFPAALLTDPSSPGNFELVASDARKGKDGYRNAWLKCIAGISGIPFGRLLDRDLVAQRKRLAIMAVALLAIAIAIGVAGLGFLRLVQQQAQRSSNTLAELARVSASEKNFDSADRYSLAGIVGFDSMLIGFDSRSAEEQLIQSTAQTYELPTSQGLFHPDGVNVIAGGGIVLRIWDLKSGKLRQLTGGHEGRVSHASDDVSFLRVDPSAKILVTGLHTFPDICAWSLETESKIRCDSATKPYAIGFSPDGRQIPVLNVNHAIGYSTALIQDLQSGKIISSFTTEGIADARAISPDGTKVALAQGSDLIQLFSGTSGKSLQHLQDFSGSDREILLFSPDSKRILSAGRDITGETQAGYLALWQIGSDDMLWKNGPIQPWGHGAQFSPDGEQIAVSSNDKVLLLDANTGATLQTLKRDFTGAFKLAFSPDGTRIAFSVADLTVRLWDLRTGKEVARFRGHDKVPSELSFSSDGKRLMTTSEHGLLRIWDIDRALHLRGAELVAVSCAKTLAEGKSRFSNQELARAPMLHPILNADPCRPPTLFQTLRTAFGL